MPAPERFEAEVGGETAALVDLPAALREYIPYALAIIVGTLFILLMIMLRSLLIPLKAIVMNILALSAAFGAQVWIFQDGRFTDLLGFTPVGSIDATQPILIFAIAFGLSMDYAAFLLSRIKEDMIAPVTTPRRWRPVSKKRAASLLRPLSCFWL